MKENAFKAHSDALYSSDFLENPHEGFSITSRFGGEQCIIADANPSTQEVTTSVTTKSLHTIFPKFLAGVSAFIPKI